MKHLISILIIISFVSCGNNSKMVDNHTVEYVDINRFLGKWYEIARFPHSFEKGLVGVTAEYSMRENGKIKVVNQGYKKILDGELSRAVGKAKIPDPQKTGHLRVSFFWIFYSDYLIMELDEENYSWAVIGSSSSKYLWILSRTPNLEESLLNDIISKVKNRGYDTSKLIMVEQEKL